ncbi:MAG: sensor histidine kinase [Acidobacteriota bacterium]
MTWSRRLALAVGAATLIVGSLGLTLLHWQSRADLRTSEDVRLTRAAAALADSAAAILEAPGVESYQTLCRWGAASGFRFTLLAADGTVRADSETMPDLVRQMENHGGRPEVVTASSSGIGMSRRRSATTNRVTTYVAQRLGPAEHPAGYLRVAWEEPGLPLPWLGAGAVAVVALAAALVAGALVRRRQLAVARHLSPWCDLPAEEDLEAIAEDADRTFRSTRDALSQELGVMRSALAEVSQGVIVLDHEEKVRYANPAAVRLIREELTVGRVLVESVRTPELITAVRDALAGSEVTHTTIPGAAGAEIAVRVCPLPHPVLAAAIVLRDLSGQRQLERARRALVADLAHELRTPITVLGALAEELREEGASPELVPTLERQVRRLRAFAEELEELTSIESGQLKLQSERVDVLAAARAVVEDLRPRAEAADVAVRLAGESVTLETDPVRLAQVFTNLIDNAIRYNRPGGSVAVTISHEGAAAARVGVADTGIGIPTADQPLVFQRFYRVRRGGGPEGGSGLGLAIVKHLVRALGGSIELASREGEGTVITIVLPVTARHGHT